MLLLAGTAACSSAPAGSGRKVDENATYSSDFPYVALAGIDRELRRLPMSAYLPQGDQVVALERAKDLVANACMRAFGFSVPARPAAAYDAMRQALDANLTIGMGVVDARLATDKGYGAPEDDEKLIAARAHPVEKMSAEARGVYHGNIGSLGDKGGRTVPPDGCSGEAVRLVVRIDPAPPPSPDPQAQPPSGASYQTAQVDRVRLEGEMRADSRYLAMEENWLRCMNSAGYRFESLRGERPGFSSKGKEVEAALTEITCKDDVNFGGLWLGLSKEYQRRHIERFPEQYADEKRIREEQLRRANQVLSGEIVYRGPGVG